MLKQPFFYLSGWTHLGRVIIASLPKDLQDSLKNNGDAITIKKRDRYRRYINHGFVTASSKRPVADFYRKRFQRF